MKLGATQRHTNKQLYDISHLESSINNGDVDTCGGGLVYYQSSPKILRGDRKENPYQVRE
jgi:hypothetical protein